MGDHFVLLVDRLLTESTLEAAIASRNQSTAGSPDSASTVDLETDLLPKKRAGDGISAEKLVQCRICHDEDEDSNMEIPCSCAGSLKYAHRRCVQRWCNEKGDITCEICLQQFKPGYTAPPKLFLYGSIPMNFRGNWEVSQRDIHNHRYITMTPSDRDIAGPDYRDYSASNTRSIMYCRLITLVFMVLLILRHTLPIIMNGAEQNSLPVLAVSLTLLLLRTVGIILPLYIMLRAVTTFHRRRQQQEIDEASTLASERENGQPQPLQPTHPQPHIIRVY
ncbi:uncharacterized protein [Elaeis guineensis]|uniref:Uncharacterized protein LOC105046849 isoform X1 n=1 Tax=Elaeis guineensis var. tenera TaxID=51953 RepID=A0A6I9RIW7_ELAGV|nr:uncharacterized protein LOC105046849 isoform X1 [Elaeis guineensis]XP_010923962.1 uncharacterized protein LOC105046849 isoform X1 [Elaeis guineensis]XP_019704333.1 uncharacterized protein LOC105046849 isoform X1 [Elaeis guineensis]